MKVTRITDGHGLNVDLLDYGARIAGIAFEGQPLALAYENLEDYTTDQFYMGTTIGPITNRVSNARIVIDDQVLHLPANEGNHCLHSGGQGFDKRTWQLTTMTENQADYELEFDLNTFGMRGTLHTTARYRVINNALTLEYISRSDTTTFINLTNHVYLNLNGQLKTLTDHDFELYAHSYLEVDDDKLPTGKKHSLFCPFKCSLADQEYRNGFDNHFDIQNDDSIKKMLVAKSNITGVSLTVSGTSPGFQFYTGKFLQHPFKPSSGFCVETQYAPDAINQTGLYAPLLEAGQKRQQTTVFHFKRHKM